MGTNSHSETYTVTQPTLLLPFLLAKLAPQSRTKIKTALVQGSVSVDGTVQTKHDFALNAGSVVEIGERTKPKNAPLHILYEDQWIIVIEKPSGLLSVGNPTTKEENAWHILRQYVREHDAKSDVYVCHRLDQYTSGILLFAKDKDVQMALRDSWNDYVLDRRYAAVTEVVPTPPKAELRSYLAENAAMQVYSTRNPHVGKLAITRYKVVAQNGTMALLDIQICTGRKNQIRVQLSEHGWCIAGDRKYGAKTDPEHRLMLHNNRLVLIHPVTNKEMVFELPVPNIFTKHFKKK